MTLFFDTLTDLHTFAFVYLYIFLSKTMLSLFFALIFISKSCHCFDLIHKACDEYAVFTRQPYFVDKSAFLSLIFRDEMEAKRTNDSKMAAYYYQDVVTTPPGFGKSTNLMMIKAFAQVELTADFKPKPKKQTKAYKIFKSMKSFGPIAIALNEYYVLSLDLQFSPAQLTNESVALDVLRDKIKNLYLEYEFVKPVVKDESDRNFFEKVLQCDLDRKGIIDSLFNLVYILNRAIGKREIFLLVDNYDSLIWYLVKDPKYYLKSVDDLVKEMLLELTYRRIRVKHSIFFGVTNFNFHEIQNKKTRHFRFYSFLANGLYQNFFGFTSPEFEELMQRYNCSKEEKERVAKYYKPYFSLDGKSNIWNPTSITNYLMSRKNGSGSLEPYWGRNQSIDFLLDFAKAPYFKDQFRDFLFKGKMRQASFLRFHPQSMFIRFLESAERNYENLHEDDVVDLFVFLHECGFVSTGDKRQIFKVPNIEVEETLKDKILSKLNWK